MRVKGPIIRPRRVTPKDLADRLYDFRGLLTVGVLVALLVVVGWWGYGTWQARRETAAQGLLAEAVEALQSAPESQTVGEPSPESGGQLEAGFRLLERVRAEYPSSPAAEQALLHEGNALYQNGDHKEALHAYQRYLEQYPTGSWVFLAGLGKGYALQGLQRYEEAAATFRTLADSPQASVFKAEALMGLARSMMQLARPTDAMAAYRRVIEDYPTSPWSEEAERELASLER